jgi:hypothetical protein
MLMACFGATENRAIKLPRGGTEKQLQACEVGYDSHNAGLLNWGKEESCFLTPEPGMSPP